MLPNSLQWPLLLAVILMSGCRTCDRNTIDYTPIDDGEWLVSTPGEQGLDPELVTDLYCQASLLDDIFSVLVIKNGTLVAEAYYNDGSIDDKSNRQSVTKSFTSALVGQAIERGYIDGVDQEMMGFFPELDDDIDDSRKEDITVGQLLQMRGGYPWEEEDYLDALFSQEYVRQIVDLPLTANPGTRFEYSSMSSHWLSVIVERASGQETQLFAQEALFGPLGIEIGEWTTDKDGYDYGFAELGIRARDMARFGQMYLDDGMVAGQQIVPAAWVQASLASYTENIGEVNPHRIGRNYKNVGYGYQWWLVEAGDHRYSAALGHGGQQIVLLQELDMVIVVTADPQYLEWGGQAWKAERDHLNLVADWIEGL